MGHELLVCVSQSQQIGTRCGDGVHVPRSPVVPDQVDRAVERFDLPDEPVAVVEPGPTEPFGNRGTEPRRRQQDDVVDATSLEFGDEFGPHECGLWISVHE